MAAEKNTKVYDMLRNKARDMGHAAADLPDAVWDKYSRMVYKRNVLNDSKLIITDYIMGRLSPVDLAEAMATDDALRYAISDVCRMRLEPADIDIQHNGNYIDIGAGVKTFWSEMQVPIPSEVEAARDLRNIYFGIEAGRASMDVTQEKPDEKPAEQETEQNEPKKKSIRERIHEAKQRAAQKGIDILSPIANEEEQTEQEVKEEQEMNDFEQLLAMGLDPQQAAEAYQNILLNQRAKEIENISMTVEASKDSILEDAERVNALKAVGVSEEKAEELVQEPAKRDLKTEFTEEELNQPMNDQIAEILDQIQEHASRENQRAPRRGIQRPYQEKKEEQPEAKQRAPRRGIQRPYQEKKEEQPEAKQDEGQDENKPKRLRKGYVSGEFEGKDVRFKGSWSSHTFSEEEVGKLLAGESITFMYTNKSGEEKEVSGKLEYQTHNGHDYLGFKANFNKKQRSVETPDNGDDSLFNAQDEAIAMGETDVPMEDLNGMFGDPDPEADMAAYEQMKASGEIEEEPSYTEDVDLTDADVSAVPSGEMPFAK